MSRQNLIKSFADNDFQMFDVIQEYEGVFDAAFYAYIYELTL